MSKQIKLSGTFNTRDLCGYTKINGGSTKAQKLIRSDGLYNLSLTDCETLYNYGVRKVIDLRADYETSHLKCSLISYKDIEYINIPLLDDFGSNSKSEDFPKSLSQMYTGLYYNSSNSIKQVLLEIIKGKEDCTIFNCTFGKDRTGIISALLLLINNVTFSDVLENYEKAEIYNVELNRIQIEKLNNAGIYPPDFLFKSPKVELASSLNKLTDDFGSISGYLKHIGLNDAEILELGNIL